MTAPSIAALLDLAGAADQSPAALRSAREAMQLLDPNGSWSPAACRADGLPLAGPGEILPVVQRWRREIADAMVYDHVEVSARRCHDG